MSIQSEVSRLWEWVIATIEEFNEKRAPVTISVVGLICTVFLAKIGLSLYYGLPALRVFATGLFGIIPPIAWFFSPVLHKTLLHWLVNVVFLFVLGTAVEQHWNRGRFVAFLIVSGYLSIASGAAMMLAYSTRQIAFYGSSGIVFAFGGFALFHRGKPQSQMSRLDRIATLFGGIATIALLLDLLTGPYFDPHWINGGHIAGIVLGAGYPVVIQRYAGESLLSVARIAFGVDNAFTIGGYSLLLVFYEPVSAVLFGVAYVVSRLTVLVGFFARFRR